MSKVRFNDVAGLDEAVHEFQEVIDIMNGDPRFEGQIVDPPKGILLEGPPGTGKTLLAKAVAGEAMMPFFYANGSEFVEMFVGVAASRVRDLFKRARDVAPAIIFIDELDTLGKSRAFYDMSDPASQERAQGLMQLLVEMDGFDPNQTPILIIGATNLASLVSGGAGQLGGRGQPGGGQQHGEPGGGSSQQGRQVADPRATVSQAASKRVSIAAPVWRYD